MSHRFRDLIVWQRAMQFVTQIYVLTRDFPQHELFGLTSQLRRAAISVPLNIAEGAGSDSSNEFKRFSRHSAQIYLRNDDRDRDLGAVTIL